MTVNDRNMKGL